MVPMSVPCITAVSIVGLWKHILQGVTYEGCRELEHRQKEAAVLRRAAFLNPIKGLTLAPFHLLKNIVIAFQRFPIIGDLDNI